MELSWRLTPALLLSASGLHQAARSWPSWPRRRKRMRTCCHSSCCSNSWPPTNRTIEASHGKMPSTLVRRLTSLLSRSSGFVAPDRAPVLLWEVKERQHVAAGGFHHRFGGREHHAQHLGDPLPVRRAQPTSDISLGRRPVTTHGLAPSSPLVRTERHGEASTFLAEG